MRTVQKDDTQSANTLRYGTQPTYYLMQQCLARMAHFCTRKASKTSHNLLVALIISELIWNPTI